MNNPSTAPAKTLNPSTVAHQNRNTNFASSSSILFNAPQNISRSNDIKSSFAFTGQ